MTTLRGRRAGAGVVTIRYLTEPGLAGFFWPVVLTAILVALLGGALSWLVVVRRLSFIGQGISHSAFGGVGLALVLGFGGASAGASLGLMAIVLGFAIISALLIAAIADRRTGNTDAAIGIVLSVAMAIGFLLHHHAQRAAAAAGEPPPPSIEQVLFGSITTIGWYDFWIGAIMGLVALSLLAWRRHAVLFWMFDEPAAEAFGVPTAPVRSLVLAVLAVVVVITMKLAGVVLATAVLVLPGAIALRLSSRLGAVVLLSIAFGLACSLIGLVAAFEFDVQPGPTIVLALVAAYIVARVLPVRAQ